MNYLFLSFRQRSLIPAVNVMAVSDNPTNLHVFYATFWYSLCCSIMANPSLSLFETTSCTGSWGYPSLTTKNVKIPSSCWQ